MINNSQIATNNAGGQKKSYDPLPDGSYTVQLDKAEVKSTKNNDGFYLACSFKVSDGEHKTRLVWDNFMLSSSNGRAKGVQVGLSRLDKMLKSIGVYGGFESLGNDGSQIEQFSGRELIIKTSIEHKEPYKPRNTIDSFSRK